MIRQRGESCSGHIDRGFASAGIAQRYQDTAETKAAQRRARHRAADAFDNDIDATAGRYPVNAVGETFPGEVNHIFEAKLA
jgi:aminoglycoside phosphotransferase